MRMDSKTVQMGRFRLNSEPSAKQVKGGQMMARISFLLCSYLFEKDTPRPGLAR